MFWPFFFALTFCSHNALAYDACNKRTVEHGTVCVCNSTYCDTVPDLADLSSGQYQLYTTSRSNLGFSSKTATFDDSSSDVTNTIKVNVSETYQSIIGFGGAFTDSAGINILNLPEDAQEKLLESYFGDSGVGYSLCRVTVGGTDFSTRGYTYCDEEDETLESFALQPEDLKYKIPLIQKAKELRGNSTFNLFGSAWSAPIWMKTNNEYSGFGWLKKEYYQLWAEYYIKFLDAYEEHNITFWGLTTQNEPFDGLIPSQLSKLNAMGWLPSWMNNWVGTNLGPTLRNSTHSDVKIILHDDNRILLPVLNKLTLSNETVLQYADGVAVHFYTDFFTPASWLKYAKTPKKDLILIASEACEGYLQYFGIDVAVKLGSWSRALKYANFILDDLEYGANGWVDWNMVLNETGGPTYIDNIVDASIIVNASAEEFYKQPMFYIQGHFSKFLIPDSVKVGAEVTLEKKSLKLRAQAFLRPDNLVAVVIHNSEKEALEVQIDISGSTATLELEALSINTLLYPLDA